MGPGAGDLNDQDTDVHLWQFPEHEYEDEMDYDYGMTYNVPDGEFEEDGVVPKSPILFAPVNNQNPIQQIPANTMPQPNFNQPSNSLDQQVQAQSD